MIMVIQHKETPKKKRYDYEKYLLNGELNES